MQLTSKKYVYLHFKKYVQNLVFLETISLNCAYVGVTRQLRRRKRHFVVCVITFMRRYRKAQGSAARRHNSRRKPCLTSSSDSTSGGLGCGKLSTNSANGDYGLSLWIWVCRCSLTNLPVWLGWCRVSVSWSDCCFVSSGKWLGHGDDLT